METYLPRRAMLGMWLGLAAAVPALAYSLWLTDMALRAHQPLLLAIRGMFAVVLFCNVVLLLTPLAGRR